MTLKKFDLVELVAQLPGHDIPLGTIGTVAQVHPGKPVMYEIELISSTGDSFADITVEESAIRKISK